VKVGEGRIRLRLGLGRPGRLEAAQKLDEPWVLQFPGEHVGEGSGLEGSREQAPHAIHVSLAQQGTGFGRERAALRGPIERRPDERRPFHRLAGLLGRLGRSGPPRIRRSLLDVSRPGRLRRPFGGDRRHSGAEGEAGRRQRERQAPECHDANRQDTGPVRQWRSRLLLRHERISSTVVDGCGVRGRLAALSGPHTALPLPLPG
jgi:hypothetical protein